MTNIELIWMQVQAEMDFELKHPQELHGTDKCPGCAKARDDENQRTANEA